MEQVSVFKLKEALSVVSAELQSENKELRSLLADTTVKMEVVNEKKAAVTSLEERFNSIKTEVEKAELENKARIIKENPYVPGAGDKERMKAATGQFVRAAIKGGELSDETRNLLGALPTPNATGGDRFLPVNMQNELVSEPFVRNPLREVVNVSAIRGLELPKISYEILDDDFIVDGATAKELDLTGAKVTFGRFKLKVKSSIADTIMHGSDIDLAGYVQNALNSGLAAKEKKVMLSASPATGEEHMSFYSSANGIAVKQGTTFYTAIKAALADLHEDYRENTKIVMRFSDYLSIIEVLANNNAAFYALQPEQILGKPVIFCDGAINPIVGDFSYARLNYDGPMVYDTDKNITTGNYEFVITAWFDVQILLKSAFRIAQISV